jgi:hypothetical protein
MHIKLCLKLRPASISLGPPGPLSAPCKAVVRSMCGAAAPAGCERCVTHNAAKEIGAGCPKGGGAEAEVLAYCKSLEREQVQRTGGTRALTADCAATLASACGGGGGGGGPAGCDACRVQSGLAAGCTQDEVRAYCRGAAATQPKGKIHRVEPDSGSTLTVSNRDSHSNCWAN